MATRDTRTIVAGGCYGAHSMRGTLGLVLWIAGCAGATAAPASRPAQPAPGPEPSSAVAPAPTTSAPCIVVGATASAEGTLVARSGPDDAPALGLALRLTRPRCIAGLPRAGFVTEVAVATAGPDLRPLIDARVRLEGDVIAGENDMGGPAVVLLVKGIERLAPASDEP